MIHKLKIGDEYLRNLTTGAKKCEIRLNDRDYQMDDILEFWDSEYVLYRYFVVTHIHSGLGLQENYVVLSISKISQEMAGITKQQKEF
jgi:ASC-1-like (ASCH) protein